MNSLCSVRWSLRSRNDRISHGPLAECRLAETSTQVIEFSVQDDHRDGTRSIDDRFGSCKPRGLLEVPDALDPHDIPATGDKRSDGFHLVECEDPFDHRPGLILSIFRIRLGGSRFDQLVEDLVGHPREPAEDFSGSFININPPWQHWSLDSSDFIHKHWQIEGHLYR